MTLEMLVSEIGNLRLASLWLQDVCLEHYNLLFSVRRISTATLAVERAYLLDWHGF